MTDTKKYYYLIITVYPMKGSPYPKTFLTDIHPLEEIVKFAKFVESLPVKLRPYRTVLTFFHEISQKYYEEHKDNELFEPLD